MSLRDPRWQGVMERIASLPNEATFIPGTHTSHHLLLYEHLRRRVLWCQRFDPQYRSWPWRDIALCVNPDIRAEEEVTEEVKALLIAKDRYDAVNMIEPYLHWCRLGWEVDVSEFDLPDPFEALLFFFERGGGDLRRENMFLDFISGSIRVDADSYLPPRLKPVVELDHALLDRIDEESRRQRNG